jgi:hypothetical protein
MINRLKHRWPSFKISALGNFGEFIWWGTLIALCSWVFMMVLLLLMTHFQPASTLQVWLNHRITYDGPLWVGGLFFLGLAFLISLLIDTVFVLWHSRQIKTALFQVLNGQSYSDSLQSILDEITKPDSPSQAVSEYVRLRRWIRARISRDVAPDETAPDTLAMGRWIVKHVYRTSGVIGLFATTFYTLRAYDDAWGTRWAGYNVFNAMGAALPHAWMGLLFCGLFFLIYTLITMGDEVRKENRERVSLLHELTDSTLSTSMQDTQPSVDTLGLHSLEEEQFQAAH